MKDNIVGDAGHESTLDIEYISTMAAGIPTQFWHYACTKEACHPFLSFLMDLSALDDAHLPKVISLSVGVMEYE